MISLGPYDENLICENQTQQDCSYQNFNIYEANCSKPCSIVQYTRRIDYWDVSDSYLEESSFTVYLRFSPPLISTVYQEYIIYDIFGMIGTVGGTFGMFIGFSCSSVLSSITNLYRNNNSRTSKWVVTDSFN